MSDGAYEKALSRIEAARKTRALVLELDGFRLTELPSEIGQLQSLKVLNLDDNRLTYFHAGRFKQLSQTGGRVIEELIA